MSSAEDSHTLHTGLKLSDAYNVITDPNVLPSLDKAPVTRRLRSYLVLIVLLTGALLVSWFFGVDILQTDCQIISIGILIAIGLGLVGGWNIDWWDLVLGYWWLSMPVAGLAGIAFVVMQERTSGVVELD